MPSIAAIRKSFAKAVTDASRGEIIPITRGGEPVAAIVPYEMALLLEHAEDLKPEATKAARQPKGKKFMLIRDARVFIPQK